MKKYSEQIYKIRKAEGLSQEEFGNRIGVSRQMVSKWEMGESSPRTDKINKICTTFGITPGEFISDDEQDKESKKITKIIFNNKKEKVIKSQQQRKKRIKQITILIISVISAIYIICSLCKFIYLKSLNKEMLKFKGLNNYYFILTTYMEDKAVTREEVWYLDGKYKIEKTYTSYDENINDKKSVSYVDINNSTEQKYIIDNSGMKHKSEKNIYDDATYQKGNLLYNYFPSILSNSNKEIFINSIKFGFFRTINSTENKRIIINNNEITLDKETKIPISQKTTSNTRKHETSKIVFLKAKFNCVKDEDVKDIYKK